MKHVYFSIISEAVALPNKGTIIKLRIKAFSSTRLLDLLNNAFGFSLVFLHLYQKYDHQN